MTTATKRTCATCVAYNPNLTGNEPVCFNLVSIMIHHVNEHGQPIVIRQPPDADFCCGDHQTHEEDAQEAVDVARKWAKSLAQQAQPAIV